MVANLLGVHAIGDQLSAGGKVDAIKARPFNRRGGNTDVDFLGASLTQHPHQGPLGVSTHDRVINHHQALAFNNLTHRVELEPNTQLAQGLGGLDEGAAHIGVFHNALGERNT